MQRIINRMWQEDDGVLSFEWVMLITLLVIGIVGGLAAARDAIIDELGDIAQAAINLDQSYVLIGYELTTNGQDPQVIVVPTIEFEDTQKNFVTEGRTELEGQGQFPQDP
jgi:Flp pilus assembly pilin Flp